MANLSDALKRRIEEILDDIEHVEDLVITDTFDPEVITITIRGRLKKQLQKQQAPISDYDRAMKGISPCENKFQNSRSNN